MLGYDLPGYPDTTGWALLGLEAAVRAGAATRAAVAAAFQRGLTAMSVERDTAISPLPLALEMLARRAARGATSVQHDAVVAGQPAGKRGHLLAEPLAELLATALVSALADVNAGYPMLETRTAVLSLLALHDVDLLALHDVDLLALHAVDWPAVMSTTPHASS